MKKFEEMPARFRLSGVEPSISCPSIPMAGFARRFRPSKT
jgi:hypothetical protein